MNKLRCVLLMYRFCLTFVRPYTCPPSDQRLTCLQNALLVPTEVRQLLFMPVPIILTELLSITESWFCHN